MLAALCEKAGVDNLKLLEPFVMICLSEVAEQGKQIPKGKVLELMDQRFGFQSMPEAALDKILIRLSNKSRSNIIQKKRNIKSGGRQFVLVQKPEQQVTNFLVQEEKAKRDTEIVENALLAWIELHRPGQKLTKEEIRKYLGNFFESNGFDVLYETEELRGATIHSTEAMNYQIGRFILDAQENNPELFAKILAIAQGMIIASVIYVDTKPQSAYAAQRRLADVNVYLDTTFLLYALHFKTDIQKNSADALINLLRNNGAHLYVFPQHYTEIKEILNTFKNRDAYSYKTGQTLEALEGYTSLEIDREIKNLEASLNKLGVEVASKVKYTDSGDLLQDRDAYIDYKGLKSHLISKISQYGKRPTMLDNDLEAISAIMIKRLGMTYSDIESCQAIFVTTNYTLARESNNFLHYPVYTTYITPVISDMDITTILWINYAMETRTEIPKLRLIEYARAALNPSVLVMETFSAIARRMVKKDMLTEDEAADFRYGAYARAEIMESCGGDATVLDDTSVLAVRERVKSHYVLQEKARAAKALEDALQARRDARSAKEVSNANRQLDAIEGKINQTIAQIRKDSESKAKKIASVVGRSIEVIFIISILSIMAIFGWGTAKAGLSASNSVSGIISLIAAVLGAVLMWLPALKLPDRIYRTVSIKLFDLIYCHKLEKAKPMIDNIKSIMRENSNEIHSS